MFEKEAEYWIKNNLHSTEEDYCKAFKDGAEFGYNKAKEETENQITELKTKKIPQLERKIASIRGCHSVDVKKLNARIEQVERLKKENAEVREELTKAKKIISNLYAICKDNHYPNTSVLMEQAEQFLKEIKEND